MRKQLVARDLVAPEAWTIFHENAKIFLGMRDTRNIYSKLAPYKLLVTLEQSNFDKSKTREVNRVSLFGENFCI